MSGNAAILKQRREQQENDVLEQKASEEHKRVWKIKTDKLAFRANLRYDRANMNAQQAEMRIEGQMEKKEQFQVERKG